VRSALSSAPGRAQRCAPGVDRGFACPVLSGILRRSVSISVSPADRAAEWRSSGHTSARIPLWIGHTMPDDSTTPVTFSTEERAVIRAMLASEDTVTNCPRCQSALTLEQVGEGPFAGQFYVLCRPCNRTAFLSMKPRGGSFNR
jgi:hypothetical protein